MLPRLLTAVLLLASACSAPPEDADPPAATPTEVLAGTIRVDTLASSTLGRAWAYGVYLPPGYESQGGEAYPVLYLLHGSGGDATSWNDGFELLDSLIQVGAHPPTVAVAPGVGTTWWVDGVEPFETAFTRDLMPHVTARYRTSTARADRVIAGFSMGGYGALRYAVAYPDSFGAAILLSPALYDAEPPAGSSAIRSEAFATARTPGFDLDRWTALNYPAALEPLAESARAVPLFIVVGDDDWHHEEGARFDMEQQAVRLYSRYAKEEGHRAELRIRDGGHDWDVWGPGLRDGLRYARTLSTTQPSEASE